MVKRVPSMFVWGKRKQVEGCCQLYNSRSMVMLHNTSQQSCSWTTPENEGWGWRSYYRLWLDLWRWQPHMLVKISQLLLAKEPFHHCDKSSPWNWDRGRKRHCLYQCMSEVSYTNKQNCEAMGGPWQWGKWKWVAGTLTTSSDNASAGAGTWYW